MRKNAAFFVLFLLVWPLFSYAAVNFAKSKSDNNVSPPVEESSKKLRVGEHLVFDVYWMGLPIGVASLEVREIVNLNGRPAYHVIAIARTQEALSKLFPVYDEIHSKIDVQEFYSHEFSKNLKEGWYRAEESVVFDTEKRKGFYESFLNKTKKEFAIPPKPQDFLSVFYWFRTQPVEVGRTVHTVLSDKGKDYDVEIEVLRKVKQELRGGQGFWTLEVEPKTRYKEVLYRRGRGWVNFTLDAARTPVLIRISTPFGPVTAALRAQDSKL